MISSKLSEVSKLAVYVSVYRPFLGKCRSFQLRKDLKDITFVMFTTTLHPTSLDLATKHGQELNNFSCLYLRGV